MFTLDLPSDVPPWQRWLLRACVALPWLMLAANLVAWWRWGIDLPFFDDWRAYDERNALSLDLKRLFSPVNNTISPIGLALDVFAQRWMGGNSLLYQTLTMLIVLGGLLWLQWYLLGWVVRDFRLRPIFFGFSFFMLQTGSYWGEQNLAYHQALPLLALLGATAIALRGHETWRILVVFCCGLISGFSYISGALAAFVMGVCWVALGWRQHDRLGSALALRVYKNGLMLLLAGGVSSVVQLWITRSNNVPIGYQYMGITWPVDSDFWVYLIGKIGRSTGYSFSSIKVELIWILFLLVIWFFVLFFLFFKIWRKNKVAKSCERRLAVVLIPLSAAVTVYLIAVSLGRAGLRDQEIQGSMAVFKFAYERFHYFWVTILFPWAVAGLVLGRKILMQSIVVPFLMFGLVFGVAGARGVFDVSTYYQAISNYREKEIQCLSEYLGSGDSIGCFHYDLMQIYDLTRAFIYARDIDASFVRYFPVVSSSRFGRDVLNWTESDDFREAKWLNIKTEDQGWMRSDFDPQMIVFLPSIVPLSRCRVLGVQIGLDTAEENVVQVFYKNHGEHDFSEMQSVRRAYHPDRDGHVQIEFSIDNKLGFSPQLRIDPVEGESYFRMTDFRVTCRLLNPA